MTAKGLTAEPFNLLRSFSVLSLVTIALISTVSAYALFQFLRDHLLERDAVVSMEYIQSVSQINDPGPYFRGSYRSSERGQLEEFFEHVTHIPDVLRANAYSQDQTIIWSSDKRLIGKRFQDNPELQEALKGQLVFERKRASGLGKVEHTYFPAKVTDFLESYIPIWDQERSEVIGVVEIYKAPTALLQAFEHGRWLVGIVSLLGGLLLYAILFWIVRRASVMLHQQQQNLVEAEKLAVVGEMASSVTHSLRNPLAAIRSSAELTLEESDHPVREYAEDIVREVDRLDQWVRQLLAYSRDDGDSPQTASIAETVDTSLTHFGHRPEQQSVHIAREIPENLPLVQANPDFLTQVLINLIANALEAMPEGGQLTVRGERVEDRVAVRLIDTGGGIPEQQLGEIFRPLISHKPGGLGMGLPLARRILQRYGGSLELFSREGDGTTVLLQLPAVG